MIKNVPDYADDFPYIVARECDGADWFWGAFDNADKAEEVAKNVSGFVVFNPDWSK